MIRTIPLKIQNEYITGDKGMIGAAGSHNDVILRMEFSGMWDGLTKMVQFRDALGEATIEVLLTADMLEADDTSVYLVPVPNGAKKYAGEMTLCIKGAAVSAQKETRATLAVYGRFTVAESKWSADAETEADVPASNVAQLQGQIDNVLATIVDARKAATEAAKSAEGAAWSQFRAQTSEKYAGEYAQDAADSATAAANSATAAKASEDAAAKSATNAAASATSAGKSASAASEKASDAANSASAAATSAQTAQSAASAAAAAAGAASTAAEAASGSASQAQESAAAAAESAASVDGINKTAQSWAVGGTGTREGEDTNNAKYWAKQAQQAVGGVASFNGRAGSVVPQAGDYDKEMVGLGNVDNTSDLEKPISTATQTALNAKPSMVIAEIPKGRMRGDIDGDGTITQNDVKLMRDAATGIISLTDIQTWCADVNGNGSFTSADRAILNRYMRGLATPLTKTPTFADYYNNWTYHKVDDTSGYWTTELSIPVITTETEGGIIWDGTGFTGTFIKAEAFSGGVRIYANYPPIEALPCAVSYHTGAGGQFIISNTGVSETGAKYVIVDLTASGWSEEKKQIISVPGLKEDALKQLIIPTQASTDIEKYYSAGIRISARGDNTLTFSCDTIPTADIEVVLVIIPIIGKFEG